MHPSAQVVMLPALAMPGPAQHPIPDGTSPSEARMGNGVAGIRDAALALFSAASPVSARNGVAGKGGRGPATASRIFSRERAMPPAQQPEAPPSVGRCQQNGCCPASGLPTAVATAPPSCRHCHGEGTVRASAMRQSRPRRTAGPTSTHRPPPPSG